LAYGHATATRTFFIVGYSAEGIGLEFAEYNIRGRKYEIPSAESGCGGRRGCQPRRRRRLRRK